MSAAAGSVARAASRAASATGYAACVVGGNNHAQLIDGARKTLAALALALDMRQRFDFRAVVADLEKYRLGTTAMVGRAYGISLPADTAAATGAAGGSSVEAPAAAATTAGAAQLSLRKALRVGRTVEGNEAGEANAAVGNLLAPWRFVDMAESETARALLERAAACVPPRHRLALYPLLMKFMGSLRVVDIDARLFALPTAHSGLVTTQHPPPPSPTAAAAAAEDGATSDAASPTPTLAAVDSGAAVPRLSRIEAAHSIAAAATAAGGGGVAGSGADAVSWTSVLSQLQSRTGTGVTSAVAARTPPTTTTLPALFASPGGEESSSVATGPVAALATSTASPPAVHLTRRDAAEFARRLCLMLNTKDYGRLHKALGEHAHGVKRVAEAARRLEAAVARATTAPEAVAAAVAAGQRVVATAARKLPGSTPSSAPPDATTTLRQLTSAMDERVGVLLRVSNTIFGPLAFLLDAPFGALVSGGVLTAEVMARARRVALLQDAQLAIAEELLLDEDDDLAPGLDATEDVLFQHFPRAAAASGAIGVRGAGALPPRPPPLVDAEEPHEVVAAAPPQPPATAVAERTDALGADAGTGDGGVAVSASTLKRLSAVHETFHTALLPLLTSLTQAKQAAEKGVASPAGAATAAALAAAAPTVPPSPVTPPSSVDMSTAVGSAAAALAAAASAAGSSSASRKAAAVAGASALPHLVGPWATEGVHDRWSQVGVRTSLRLFDDSGAARSSGRLPGSAGAAQSALRGLLGDDDSGLEGEDEPVGGGEEAGEGGGDGGGEDSEAAREPATPGALDDALISVKQRSPPSRAYFQQAILAPFRFVASKQPAPPPPPGTAPAPLLLQPAPPAAVAPASPLDTRGVTRGALASGGTYVVVGPLPSANLVAGGGGAPTASAPAVSEVGGPLARDVAAWNSNDNLLRKVCIGQLPFDVSVETVVAVLEHAARSRVVRMELWNDRAKSLEHKVATAELAALSRARWQAKNRGKGVPGAKRGRPRKGTVRPTAAGTGGGDDAGDGGDDGEIVAEEDAVVDEDEEVSGAGAEVGDPTAAGGVEPLPSKRLYRLLEERRKKSALQSPLCAFAYFEDSGGAVRALAEHLRLFGIVIGTQACRIEAAADRRALYVGGLPRGMTPDAASAALGSVLAGELVSLRVLDRSRLRHGVVCNGDAYLEFKTHAAAVCAAYALRGAELAAGTPLVVGWATGDEWRTARPRLPAYF